MRRLLPRAGAALLLALPACGEDDLGVRVPACGAWLRALDACAAQALPGVQADLARLRGAVLDASEDHDPLPAEALATACTDALKTLEVARPTLCPAPSGGAPGR